MSRKQKKNKKPQKKDRRKTAKVVPIHPPHQTIGWSLLQYLGHITSITLDTKVELDRVRQLYLENLSTMQVTATPVGFFKTVVKVGDAEYLPSLHLDYFEKRVGLSGNCTCNTWTSDKPCSHLMTLVFALMREFWENRGKVVFDKRNLAGLRLMFEGLPARHPVSHFIGICDQTVDEWLEKYNQQGGQPHVPERWWEIVLHSKTPEELRANLRLAITNILAVDRLTLTSFSLKEIEDASEECGPFEFLTRVTERVLVFKKKELLKKPFEDLLQFLKDKAEENKQRDKEYRKARAIPLFIEKLKALEDIGIRTPNTRLDVVWHLKHRKNSHSPTLAFEVRQTSKRLEKEPRKLEHMRSLLQKIEDGSYVLPPIEEDLIWWVVDVELEYSPYSYGAIKKTCDIDTHFMIAEPHRWILKWGGTGLVRWENGEEVIFNQRPARFTLHHIGDDVVFGFEVPSGDDWVFVTKSQFLPEKCPILCRDTGVYSRDVGTYYFRMGQVLHPVNTSSFSGTYMEQALSVEAIPAALLKGRGIMAKVASRMRELGVEPKGLTSEVPVRPLAVFHWLDGESLRLYVRALAVDGTSFIRHPDEGWIVDDGSVKIPIEIPGVESEDHIMVEEEDAGQVEGSAGDFLQDALDMKPRREDTRPLEEWLAAFLPRRPDSFMEDTEGFVAEWRLKAKERKPLPELWLDRPGGVDYFGNAAFRDMVLLRHAPALSFDFGKSSGVDWLSLSVELEKDAARISLEEVALALRSQPGPLIRLKEGGLYKRQELEQYKKRMEFLNSIGVDPWEKGEQKLHALQLAGIQEPTEAMGGSSQLASLAALREKAVQTVKSFKGIPSAPVHGETKKWLRPYQREGVDFLVWACRTFGGAILADEMGLGKTIQVLAAIGCFMKGRKNSGPTLVICPSSVVHNWRREAEKFAPSMKVAVFEAGKDRYKLHDSLSDFDLVIINFALTRIDFKFLKAQRWLAVCIDEAQHIKNRGAAISKLVKQLDAENHIALTGTPVENRLEDLMSIGEFAVPGYLRGMQAAFQSVAGEDLSYRFAGIRARLRPVLLRRLKKEVALDLPDRIEERRDCDMVTPQKKTYLLEVKKTRELMLSPSGLNGGSASLQMLTALTRLRQICCHPELVGATRAGSGKLEELIPILREILEDGHKILVFSQFVKMIRIIEKRLKKEKIEFYTLTGQTRKRQELVDTFEKHKEPCVFLISLKAGGTGLNLTSASHVVIFDPWWNPAVEAQAIDRTHRIGQDKTVMAIRLVTRGTVEERILELQNKKRELISNVLSDEAFNRSLTREDLEILLAEPGE